MTAYAGGVFSQELEGGRAGATLSIASGSIRAQTTTGRSFEIHPARCTLDLGGASGKMWFCRDETAGITFFSEQPGFGAALADLPELSQQVTLLGKDAHARRSRARLLGTAALAAVALVLVGSFFGLKAAARMAIQSLPISIDEKLGNVAMATMDLGGRELSDPVVLQAIDRIVTRLAQHAGSEFSYDVRVVDADIINAFALPGGDIVVYTGLIQEAATIEGVAGVLAHEISHVTLRHGIERVGQSLGIAAAVQLLLGDVGGLSALVVDLVQTGALTSYGRDQERAADAEGMRILHRAGIDPRGLAQIFARLAEEQSEIALPISWLSSHPELDERIATVQATAEALGPFEARPLEIDFAALKARLPERAADTEAREPPTEDGKEPDADGNP